MSPQQLSEQQRRLLRSWRVRIFVSTWLSYVGLYFCRKPFYIVKPRFTEDLGIGAAALGEIELAYLGAYTLGQFISGGLGAITGARRLLLAGMAVAVGCNLVFGAHASYWVLLVFMVVNGLAQATGWSGNVGTMAHWTSRTDRGTIMGFWATCYLIGGILANGLATILMGWQGWAWSFFGGSAVLAAIIVVFFINQRDRPEDVGLPALEPGSGDGGTSVDGGGVLGLGWSPQVIITLLLVGGFYFCVKFIRYALWSWAPYFLRLNFGLSSYQYGFAATAFDVAGFFGVVTAGVASDRLFAGRRSVVSFLMLVGMFLGCVVLWKLGSSSVLLFTVGLVIVGFMLYGPDSLLSGAGAIDLGGRKGAIVAAGVINGMGSIGSMVQAKVIGSMYETSGGNLEPIFFVMVGAAVLALIFVAFVMLRNRAGRSDL